MKRPVTVEETFCDRCGGRVTKSGGAFVLSAEGPRALVQGFRPSVEVCTEDEGGDHVDVLAVADLCRGCKVQLQGWWERGKDEADDGQGDTAFAPPFGTIRQCRVCGCLVAGGPTSCARCAEAGD